MAKPSQNQAQKELAAEGFEPTTKGFGGFCSGIRVKLALKFVKSP